jgi:tRNA A-37 threonylcarbamoyl transferase component Bud32/tetratricopeptide (TPR) repeat protein
MGDSPPLRTSVAADLGSAADALRALAEEPLPLLPAGTVINDQFEVEAMIGRGGMGAVYRARDRALGRRVAIKLGLRGSDMSRLQREASALARLAHPNVVTIYEIGAHDGAPFVAMELCGGGTTRAWLETPRPWRAIVERFVAAGRGLAAAHAVGIVHGDVKADNILLGEDGRPRIADFGLAREATRDAATDEPERRRGPEGTPRYMAPELATGPATTRSDQFAFAVALYEALAGVAPFPAEEPARGEAIRRGPPGLLPVVPRHVSVALARAMAADPEARWPDVAALLDRLQPARSRTRWIPALALGGAAAVGVALVAWRSAADPVEPVQSVQPAKCDGLPVDLAADWTAARRAEVRAAHPRGAGAADLFVAVLDSFVVEWGEARRRLCKELPATPAWSPAVGDAGRTCLLSRRTDLRHVMALRDHEPGELIGDVMALAFPSSCADPARLEVAAVEPEVSRVRLECDAIAQARDGGKHEEALARARALVAQLPADAPPLAVAAANALLGEILLAEHGLDESAGPTRTAFFAYRVAGSAQAFEPAMRLVDAYTQVGELALAGEWLEHARTEADRIEVSATNRAGMDLVAARLRAGHGDNAGAVAAVDAALARLATSPDPRRVLASISLRSSQAIFLADLRRFAESAAVARELVAERERLYGKDHPVLISDLFTVGLGELDDGKPVEALATLRRARAIADAKLPAGAVMRGFALWNEGLALGRTDRVAARGVFDQALAIIVAAEGEQSADAMELRADRAKWSAGPP